MPASVQACGTGSSIILFVITLRHHHHRPRQLQHMSSLNLNYLRLPAGETGTRGWGGARGPGVLCVYVTFNVDMYVVYVFMNVSMNVELMSERWLCVTKK